MNRGTRIFTSVTIGLASAATTAAHADEAAVHTFLAPARAANTAAVVKAAGAFLGTLDATEITETVYPYTLTDVIRWSNLPGVTRNGPTLAAVTTTTTTTSGTRTGGGTGAGSGTGTGTPPDGGTGTGAPPTGGGSTAVTLPTFVMNDAQRAAALALAKTALSDFGFATLQNIRAADDVIAATGSPLPFGSGNYHVAILGTPSTVTPWMLQIGGHHLAYNITYNAAKVSATPLFLGVEPPNFTVLSDGTTVVAGTVDGSTLYFVNGKATSTAPDGTVTARVAPLEAQRAAVYAVLQQIQADPRIASTAKLAQSFDDVTMGVSGSGNDVNYPFDSTKETTELYPTGTTGRGVLFTALNRREQFSVLNAIAAWVGTQKGDIAAELFASYIDPNALAHTYVAYSPGQGGTADFGPNPYLQATPISAEGSYFRIDGPKVWIEAVVQTSIAYSAQNWVHYHTLWRDKVADYGSCFSSGADASGC